MATIVLVHVVIDDAKPLGPQVQAARAQNVPWKVIEAATGFRRETLRDFMYRRRDRVRALPHAAVGMQRAAVCAS